MKRFVLFVYTVGAIAVIIWYIAIFFSPKDYSRPTSEFYVNDYANFFSSASKKYLINDSSHWYESTKDTDLGGFQTVVATYEVESVDEIANYNKTDIYRNWQIGENDMGLLILLFFSNTNDELVLLELELELGYRAEQYLSPITQRTIYDNVNNSHYNEEVVIVNLYYDFTGEILNNAYSVESEEFDQVYYEDYLINYDGQIYGQSVPIDKLTYLFTKNTSFYEKFSPIIIILGTLFSGTVITIFVGAGGRSGGFGLRRRR